jgi:hypothetical protein
MTARELRACSLATHHFEAVRTRDGDEARCSACGSIVPAMAGSWYSHGVRDALRSVAVADAQQRSSRAIAAGNGTWARGDVDGEAPQDAPP